MTKSVMFYKLGENEPYDCFSQWYYSPFKDYKGVTYQCAEQYLMAAKAELFNDKESRRTIMMNDNPSVIRSLGRKVKNYVEEEWVANRYLIALTANHLKFSQCEELRDILLSTGNAMIYEASPTDAIWGIGLSATKATATSITLWKGENLLGNALMVVRSMIREGHVATLSASSAPSTH